MSITILKPETFVPAQWSGGTTTQLFMYPAEAVYAQRNFLFRLSTARVEAERSEFTALPGISRHLIVLDGELTINHKGHYSKTLRKFDTDSFDGGWHTTAEGVCTDFNLMLSGKAQGKISALGIHAGAVQQIIVPACAYFFVYAFAGDVAVDYKGQQYMLPTGHMLMVQSPVQCKLDFTGKTCSELVLAEVCL